MSGSAGADVVVRAGEVDRQFLSSAGDEVIVRATANDVCLRYPEAVFRITEGREIAIDRAQGADEGAVRLLLLGPALAVLLHQRGLLVLHASGVVLGGRAVVFLGEKGEGKSTLAAALHARSNPLVADDVVAIDPHAAGGPAAYPGFPQLKLWPESLDHMGEAAQSLPRVHPDYEKRARRADERFGGDPLPLGTVYVLETAETLGVDLLPPQQRFIELTRHSYLLPLLERTRGAAAHFHQAVAVAAAVPVRRLRRPRQLEDLSAVAARIEADAMMSS